ncbi:MAG: DEAD/DEAH box helicase [Magnetococcales bacterium]|nr:DEAD/DEAH box helicase [Magnetococcales bacterium]
MDYSDLYPHQNEMIANTRLALRSITSGPRAVIMQGPTGVGKTVIMAAMSKGALELDKQVISTVHRHELMQQSSKSFEKWGIPHGVIASGQPYADEKLHIASIMTLVRRLDKIRPPDLILIDEAHHGMAKQWATVIKHWPNAAIVGVTATPQRLDGKGLDGLFQRLVIGPRVRWLIDNKFLSPYRLFIPPIGIDTSKIRTVLGDFDKQQLEEVVDKKTITGNAVKHYLRYADGKRAIVFCVSIKHARNVAAEFQNNCIEAVPIYGTDPDRDEKMRKFAAGTIQVLCSVDLISEGLDVPSVEVAILLRPTQSLAMYLQQVGRVLRYVAGKVAIILDHVGNYTRHGMPDVEHDWKLAGIPKKKGSKNDVDSGVIICEKCYCVFPPAPVCPSCGHVRETKRPPIHEVDGDLEEVLRVETAIRKKEEVKKAHSFADLERIRMQRGYAPGWTHKLMKARQQKVWTYR